MLRISDDEVHDCFVLEPSGKLTEADFEALAKRFDARVAAGSPVPNLVVHARDFPGWADFGALFAHVGFIRDHRQQIEKIALVSDSRVLDLGPKVARHFVAAEIRHFPEDALAAALDWVAEPRDRTSHVSVMADLPDDVVGLSVHGVVSARDYAETIVPLVEAKLRDHDKIRLLYRIGPEFERFTAGAVWRDTRLGMLHLTRFSRVAVVTDIDWIRQAMRLFAPLIPGEVHAFADRELAEARTWVTAK